MKNLILNNANLVLQVGDTYSTDTDDLNANKIVHIINNIRFDESFSHIETDTEIPTDFNDENVFYKYENGVFTKEG